MYVREDILVVREIMADEVVDASVEAQLLHGRHRIGCSKAA